MKKQIYKNNKNIFYKDEGKKNDSTIILIHGFLETSDTWTDFSKELSKKNRVISIDLPGHGNSDLHEEPYTMCKYAEAIKYIIDEEETEKAFIIGHSMGGYVALAFADNYPDRLSGLCLFHSTPFADGDEKRAARTEMIKQIENGELNNICSVHSKAVYSNENKSIFAKEIAYGEKIAKSLSPESVIASLLTMKNRDDRSHIVEISDVPFLYIIGKKDNFIPFDVINEIDFPEDYLVAVLDNSGHMGMVEEKEKSLKYINDFCENYL
ncbi:MAG: alpha/beta hydrolase [Bacteroidales bacterium]|nr:alpha/beta hydrolase [Bacteroidales bacterium]